MNYSLKAYFSLAVGIFVILSINGQDYKKRIENNLQLLVKDSSNLQYLKIDSLGISLFASSELKLKDKVEFHVKWQELDKLICLYDQLSREDMLSYYIGDKNFVLDSTTAPPHSSSSKQSLKGYRIAIDPGHMAENRRQAKWEKRYINAGEKGWFKTRYKFYEADLAFSTAYILKDLLEDQGAIVLISRKKDINALNIPFKKWFKNHFQDQALSDLMEEKIDSAYYDWLMNEADKKDIYRTYFRYLDFEARIKRINNWKPDLSLIIHYNAGGSGRRYTHNENHCMAFIGGSFAKSELKTAEDRMDFLRLLISKDIMESALLSDQFIHQHTASLGIAVVPPNADYPYLRKYSILSQYPGVYARNLIMTRKIKGTLCYGESLLQENLSEAKALSRKDLKWKEISTSKRVKEVAYAYYYAILNYHNLSEKLQLHQ